MFNRGGFPGQMPMGHNPMNQSGMSHPGITMSTMNVSGMNMPGMGMTPMNQPNMNLSGMNHPGMNHQLMGHSGMNHPNIGLSGMNQPGMNQPNMNMNQPNMNQAIMNQPNMNQPNMNINPMNHSNINQGGGMGFLPEMKSQAFGMRPMDSPGSFGGNTDPMGMKGMPIRSPMQMSSDRHMAPQALPQRFSSPNVPAHQGQPRMPAQSQEIPSILNMVLTHPSDRMVGNSKAPLQDPAQRMKKKRWEENVNVFGSVGQDMGMKSGPSGSSLEASKTQSRYTNESASSILESFGLSNEDLEELSRYPDDQLTPSNMPSILRDIRLRKMNRTTSVPDQSAVGRPGNEAVPSKVIDYGHLSKYQFNNPATPAQTYNSPRNEQKPVPKGTVTVVSTNTEMTPETGMDNKIPTISGSRKHVWSNSKSDRSNNKTLVGKRAPAPVNVSVSITEESPMISSQPDATAKPHAVTPVQKELTASVQVVASASQATYQQPTETPAAGKNKWVPASPKEEAQKMKMPTPSMMNDYYAASPRIFPHICSLCNVECRHLKDWIKHQNNLSHIDSCRNLRQKYPEWNPQVLSSVRNENKKDEPTSHKSQSKSASPRRSRRSGSRHKSRSRSPRSSGRRSRSRSPRRSRHSPKRSRSPRPRSPRRFRRSSRSESPDKKAVDAAVKSFIEAIKPKGGEKPKSVKASNTGKKPSSSNVRSKKPVSTALPKKLGNSASKASSTSSSSSSTKKPASNSNDSSNKPSSISAARKPSSDSSKPVVSTGAKKTTPSTSSGKKPQPSKPPAEEQPSSSPISEDTYNLSNKFTSRSNTRKIVHVTDLPDSGYTDQDILKIVQPFGRVCDILLVPSKNEAFIETNFREAAAAVVKYSETTPIMINHKRVTLSLGAQSKKPVSAEKGENLEVEPAKAPAETAAPEKESEDKKSEEPSKHDLEVPPGFIKSYMLDDPPLKQNEKCVILISNLPETQYTVDEITNLAKPFGGVNDVLLVANHRKAYLELTSKNSVDSMIKFYGVFPTYLSGNLLSMGVVQRYKDLKNEDLIFADLIEQSSYKIVPKIYQKFVHLTDLPEKDVEDFEIIRIGRRFGKVEHHVYFSNKKKAILHLHSPSAAKAMYSFLTQYPCSIADTVVQCSLPSKTELAEDEYISYIEEDVPRIDSNLEKAASEVAESKEPDKKEEKPSENKEKGSNEPDKKEEKPSPSEEKVSEEPNKKDEQPSQPKDKGSKEPNKEEKPSQHKDKGSKEPNKDVKPSQHKDKGSNEPNKEEKPSQHKDRWSKEPNKKEEKPLQPKDKGSKEPNKKEEKPLQPKDKGSKEPNKDDKPSQHKDKWSKEPNKKDEKPSQYKDKWSKEPNKKDERPSQSKDKWSKEPNKVERTTQPKSKWSKEPNKKDERATQPKSKWSKEPNKKEERPSMSKDKWSKEPNKKDEKPSHSKGKESEVGPVHSSPASQSNMDVDTAECEGPSEPTHSVESEITSGQAAADHPSVGPVPSPCMAVTTEDDDDVDNNNNEDDDHNDEDEEAAEAPEAPDTSHICIQAEPEVQHPEPQPVSRAQVSDDLEVLVSVESDEEESEGQHDFILNTKQGTQPLPVTGMAKLPHTIISAGKGVGKDAQNTIGTADEGSNKETPKHSIEKHGHHHVPTKGEQSDELDAPEATEASDVSMVRTTKYNAQKGDISVTVTLENQKSNSKTESRKRTSRERGSSSHESSTPRSSSNRSSPADSASKSGSSFSQKKTTGKYSSSQPERDSKDTRSREREARSSSRWDDRARGSSSRHSRSSKGNNRSPRSKEEHEETFPFNLDEFVTVDEIVEEHVDSVTSAEADEEKPDAARKGKRKENDPVPSVTKKSRVTSTASHKQSFVTLDEVGDEEESAEVQEDQANKEAKPLVTIDDVHTEDGPPASAKEEQILMTLDEISDEEDAQNASTGQESSKVPEIVTKDQLLTLDEVNEEEEEHATPTKPQEAVETKLLEDKDTKDSAKEPDDKHKPDVQQDAPTSGERGDHSEQALLTLDEVKAEDDEMSFADIEHQFLTVDEIGEEEEESERKAESKPSDTKESSKAEPKSTVKRGRPRKRPLPQSAEDHTGSSVQASPDASTRDAVEKSPAKPKPSQGSEGEADGVQGSTSAPPDKTESADGKPDADTLAKKARLETPPAEKTKLAPFNSSTPVGLEFLVPKTGYFCELCSLFYMDEASKLKHCKSLRHYQAVEKHLAKLEATPEGKSLRT